MLCFYLAAFVRSASLPFHVLAFCPRADFVKEKAFSLHANVYIEPPLLIGKLVFPSDYPFKPPSIRMITPNGRFQVDTRLCLSMSDFHPGTWNPSWSVATILNGLLSFMVRKQKTQKDRFSLFDCPILPCPVLIGHVYIYPYPFLSSPI
jgi:hypothetical protein